MKKLLSILLVFLMLFSIASCNGENTDTAAPGTEAETQNEDPVFYTAVEYYPEDTDEYDPSKDSWDDSITYANGVANAVQGHYTDANRTGFHISNQNMSMDLHILQNDTVIVKSLSNSKGVPYFTNTMDCYVRTEQDTYYASESLLSARMNSHRMGYYYYDFRFRDQNFISKNSVKPYEEGELNIDLLTEYADTFEGREIDNLEIKDGKCSFTINALTEPLIRNENISFASSDYDAIQIRIKTEKSDIITFALELNGSHTFGPDQTLVYRFNPGEERTIVIPFSAMTTYFGTVTGIKIAIGNADRDEKIEINEMRVIKRGGENLPLRLERSYHTYSDKMHEELRVVANGNYLKGGFFGSTVEIPADTVNSMVMKNAAGEVTQIPADFDFETFEYVGFDIKDAGVWGLIMPEDNNGTVKVELVNNTYIVTREVEIEAALTEYGSREFYHRIYTSDSHNFNDLRKEAYIERNPLKYFEVERGVAGQHYVGYDQIRGCYKTSTLGAGFEIYYTDPDRHFDNEMYITPDPVVDRKIYLAVTSSTGALECAVVLGGNGQLLPIPIEVCKNFGGENEDQLYNPGDNIFGSEAYVPLVIKKDEVKKLNLIHLYQNWGNHPLKQLSSISFVAPYYHLSTGVTETNCISPYGVDVNVKDNWMLPDFRGFSQAFWGSQPQHTSTGEIYYLQYKTTKTGQQYKEESKTHGIDSSGPIYADITMNFLSDDSNIEASYRHVELPQTDENRTYYQAEYTVLNDFTVKNFSENFNFMAIDGRFGMYKSIGYLDENNQPVNEDVVLTRKKARIVKLGTETPYVDLYNAAFRAGENSGNLSTNMAIVILNTDITIGGEKIEGKLAFSESTLGNLNRIGLTLDLDTVKFKAGDKIVIDLILLPWGNEQSQDDTNVLNVREDSGLNPCKIDAIVGEVIDDPFIQKIKAVNNEAEFTVSGGANRHAVRVYGFEKYGVPKITLITDAGEQTFEIASEHGYDGYQVYKDDDGTYSYSFIVDMDDASSYHLKITQ